MPTATLPTKNNKRISLILTILVLSTGLIAAVLFIILNRSQAPAKQAASLVCPANLAYCEWDVEPGLNYTVSIIDMSTGGPASPLGPRSGNRQYFSTKVGVTYRCTVTASNSCDSAKDSSSVEDSCKTIITTPADTSISGGPTPIKTVPTVPSDTSIRSGPTPTKTIVTLIPSAGPSPTKTPPTGTPPPGASLTPTRTPTPTTTSIGGGTNSTPTPTGILIVQATNTPGPSPTNTPQPTTSSGGSSQNTTTSGSASLPVAGSIIPSLAILTFAIVVIVIGFVL